MPVVKHKLNPERLRAADDVLFSPYWDLQVVKDDRIANMAKYTLKTKNDH